MKLKTMLIVAALGLASWGAQAQNGTPQREIMDDRWNVWLMGGGIFSDSSNLDKGYTGALHFTHPLADHFAFNGGLDYGSLGTSNAGKYNRISARLGVELFPWSPYYDSSSSLQPFIGAGGHASSVSFIGEHRAAYGPYADFGLQQRLGQSLWFRLQGSYQQDYVQAKGIFPRDNFYTWQALAAVGFSLGEKPYDHN
ncbi:MAG TPA: hypothetical protein VHE37_13795, partial [Nevskiaceae bacterium]|nr:hypothetical protein [Nevskiaceae bacterium]